LIQEQTRILTPYGGLIFIVIELYNTIGNFDLEFENVIESPRFIYGVSTNKQWAKDYQLSPAPIVELEVPGITFTIPKITLDSIDTDMELLADTWKRIMDACFELQGWVPDLEIRYVTDVENDVGSAHAGYPIQHSHLPSGFFDTNRINDSLVIVMHEIGHNLNDDRYCKGPDYEEATTGFFTEAALVKIHGEKAWAEEWERTNRNIWINIFKNNRDNINGDRRKGFNSTGAAEFIVEYLHHELGWEGFKNTMKYYMYQVPATLSPNTMEYSLSLMVKALSVGYNKNLVPYFQWWQWPVISEHIEETKNLPEWKGIIEKLETTDAKCKQWVNWGGWIDCCKAIRRKCGEGEKTCSLDSECEEGLVCKWKTCSKK